MIKFKNKKERELSRIEKRVSMLPAGDLIAWAEQSMYTIGRSLAQWQRHDSAAALEEARIHAEVLHTITETLTRRTNK